MKAGIEPLYADLGRRIHDRRVEQGLTQEHLAGQLIPRMTRASIANIETGKQRLLVHTLVQLAEALGIRPERLLRGSADDATPSSAPTPVQRIEKEMKQLNLPPKAVRAVAKQLRSTSDGGRG